MPYLTGRRPVSIAARDGEHTDDAEYHDVNLSPARTRDESRKKLRPGLFA